MSDKCSMKSYIIIYIEIVRITFFFHLELQNVPLLCFPKIDEEKSARLERKNAFAAHAAMFSQKPTRSDSDVREEIQKESAKRKMNKNLNKIIGAQLAGAAPPTPSGRNKVQPPPPPLY